MSGLLPEGDSRDGSQHSGIVLARPLVLEIFVIAFCVNGLSIRGNTNISVDDLYTLE